MIASTHGRVNTSIRPFGDGPQVDKVLSQGRPNRSHPHGLLHYFKPKTQDFQQAFFSRDSSNHLDPIDPNHPKRSTLLDSPEKATEKRIASLS